MILISTENESDLHAIAEDMDLIGDMPHCDLGTVNTLVLLQRTPAEKRGWIEGKPVVFNEEEGLAIFRLSDDALNWLHANAQEFAEEGVDPEQLKTFAGTHRSNVYAVDTF